MLQLYEPNSPIFEPFQELRAAESVRKSWHRASHPQLPRAVL
jgi:hypothetical protein